MTIEVIIANVSGSKSCFVERKDAVNAVPVITELPPGTNAKFYIWSGVILKVQEDPLDL